MHQLNTPLTPTNETDSKKLKFSHRDSMELSGLDIQQLVENQEDETEQSTNNDSAPQSADDMADDKAEPTSIHLDEEKLERRIHKYPRLAAEILCSDIDQLYSTIIGDKVLLSALLGFLSNEPSLNPTLAGYWIRVMRCLFQRRIFDVGVASNVYMIQFSLFVIYLAHEIHSPSG